MRHSISLMLMLAMLVCVGAAQAASVTVGDTFLTSYASDGTTDNSNSYTGGVPLPFNPLPLVLGVGADSATSTFSFSNSALNVGMDHVRDDLFGSNPNNPSSVAESQGIHGVIFTIQPNAPGGNLTYSLSGNYSSPSANSTGWVFLSSDLSDVTDAGNPVSLLDTGARWAIGPGSLDVAAQTGSLTGSLLAGHTYQWNYSASIQAIEADGGATATGHLTLAFGDDSVAAAVPLPTSAVMGLAMLGGLALLFSFRTPHFRILGAVRQ